MIQARESADCSVIFMPYSEFVKEAMQYYKSLPIETNALYKKYSLAIALPDNLNCGSNADADLDKMISQISEKTRIKFDVVVTNSFARSSNPSVQVTKAEDADEGTLENKSFKSSEDKLAAYINSKAKYFIKINTAKDAKSTLNILFATTGHLSTEVFVKNGESAKAEVSEFYFSSAAESATISVLHEVECAENSVMEINAFHNENEKTSVVSLCKGGTEEKAKLYLNSVYCGSNATKARSILNAKGQASRIEVTELAFGISSQQFDIDTAIINSTPYSSVSLESGVILDDLSKCMLKGFAKVADKTRGSISTIVEKGILMSKDAHMDALPDLSIDYSNEVKASHSASTTPIDQDALFYLTSRGIEESQARKLFISAFISKYISKISSPSAREIAMSIMLDKLDKKAFGTLSEITPRNIWMVARPTR